MGIGNMAISAGIAIDSTERLKKDKSWLNWLTLAIGTLAFVLEMLSIVSAEYESE